MSARESAGGCSRSARDSRHCIRLSSGMHSAPKSSEGREALTTAGRRPAVPGVRAVKTFQITLSQRAQPVPIAAKGSGGAADDLIGRCLASEKSVSQYRCECLSVHGCRRQNAPTVSLCASNTACCRGLARATYAQFFNIPRGTPGETKTGPKAQFQPDLERSAVEGMIAVQGSAFQSGRNGCNRRLS